MQNSGSVLEVKDVSVSYEDGIRAVDNVSFTIDCGETLGLVGESGCGKSTLGRAILRLKAIDSGEIRLLGSEIGSQPESKLRPLRRHMQMIFQDAYSSLDPRMSVRETIAEPLRSFSSLDRQQLHGRVDELLETVGLDPGLANSRPQAFSGGQRQRIGIARAIAAKPDLIVADEPVSALDVSIQNQILNILIRLKAEQNISFLFISHDMRAVRAIADRIAVMYLGRIVEIGTVNDVFDEPLHPYTKALMSATNSLAKTSTLQTIRGEAASHRVAVVGCRFRDRCPVSIEKCSLIDPELSTSGSAHAVACIRAFE